VSYDKPKHAPLPTNWLLENAPSELAELDDLLMEALR
jgi:hypothetical protein